MPKKILLADDSITIQKVVELTFSDGDYEVTAVNNGAKAVQKLSEMRPDIILSDIIMPEKNGYEVCEYVKSHPEYRSIPVVLLTGTFEPFDPDRADKAGCDAVVTKPFESQSLIHKVEELIQESRAAAPAAAAAAPAPESPWLEEPIPTPPPPPAPASVPYPPSQPAGEPFMHDSDLFAAAPAPEHTTEMPFEAPPPPPPAEPSPWDEPPSFEGETRAFPKATFDEFGSGEAPRSEEPAAPPPIEPSPWDEQAALADKSRDFPPMSFDEPAPEAEHGPGQSSFPVEPAIEEPAAPQFTTGEMRAQDESPFGAPPPAEDFSADTRAFPKMTFEELQQAEASTPPVEAAAPISSDARPSSPWDEQPESIPESPSFPTVDLDEQQHATAAASGAPTPWEEPAATEMPPWEVSQPATAAAEPVDEPAQPASFDLGESAVPDESPFANAPVEEAPQVIEEAPELETAGAVHEEPAWPTQAVPPTASLATSGNGAALSDEEVDRIARRVVQLISDQVVRNIAWEIIPDLAEMVVKERIRQLESES